MRLAIKTEGLAEALAKLGAAPEAVRAGWARDAEAVGYEAEGFIQKELRSGPRTDTQTQVRTNRLRRAYGHEVRDELGFIALDVGLIKPGTDAEVLGYGRAQEGFTASGQRFDRREIHAKGDGWLTFPIYRGDVPGTSKAAIEGWVRVKKVTQVARPALPIAQAKFEPILRERLTSGTLRVLQ